MGPLGILFAMVVGITLFILVLVFVVVPLLRGIAWMIGGLFRGVGWMVRHLFEFVGGIISDTLRLVGALIAMVILLPMAPLNVVLGRWSAAGHFADSVKRECKVAGACVYRIALQRPLKLFWLHGILEGLEQRVPEAMAAAPGSDKPSRRTGQFDGYQITGSLRSGGSGAKLYIARPDDVRRSRGMPEQVVIKSFAITDGSSLPQIVRESRALEAAKQLGLVLEHGMDEHRFFYIMPYHHGDHLGIVTRQLHAEAGGRGLGGRQLGDVLRYTDDLLQTLAGYHRGGLWHKDVKPENLIVNNHHAHLVDLGLVTPLRSAMTLTTHGTEYFRDPEMVRQALRGVKVHQVDGAKFDIYAAGAVLYFMLENTFPAHGGLSRFTKKSPEALRWIVRRSMTDYDKRYETADAMLADLAVVTRAGDPYAVKPAALPSMRGGSVVMETDHGPADEPVVADVAAAATPDAPADAPAEQVQSFGLKVEAGRGGVKVANLQGKTYFDSSQPRRTSRPRLSVTNWWTGAYAVQDPPASPGPAPAGRVGDASAGGPAQRNADDTAQRFRASAVSARRAAREQIRSARARADEMRRRAQKRRAHVTRAVQHRQPSAFLGFITLAVIVGGGFVMVHLLRNELGSRRTAVSFGPGGMPAPPALKLPATPPGPGAPVLLVMDGGDPDDPRWSSRVHEIIDRRSRAGFDVIVNDESTHEQWRTLLASWKENPDGPADGLLEDAMARADLYGFMYVLPKGDKGDLDESFIYSTRSGARGRRRAIAPESPGERAIVVINDHPLKLDPEVAHRINAVLTAYREHGWNLIAADNELEATVRQQLPAGELAGEVTMSPLLERVLADAGLGGVLWLYARPGDEAPEDRLEIVRLTLDETVIISGGSGESGAEVEAEHDHEADHTHGAGSGSGADG